MDVVYEYLGTGQYSRLMNFQLAQDTWFNLL